jgi:DNA-binding transcriptional regulator YdaS (Cro superfamily)
MMLNSYLSGLETGVSLAAKLGVPPALVSQWRTGARPVPIDRCVSIERATGGAVTRKDLRPDDWARIWPELADANHSAPVEEAA